MASASAINALNAEFLEALHRQFLQDPTTLSPEWRQVLADQGIISPVSAPGVTTSAAPEGAARDSVRALMLIRAYRVRGHLLANLDPLGLTKPDYYPELDPRTYGFDVQDYDRPIFMDGQLGFHTATLGQILEVLKRTYCGSIGVEFMHMQEDAQRLWVQERIENFHRERLFSVERQQQILATLTQAEAFERFLHVKYQGAKRFGVDGGEAMLVGLETMLIAAARLGAEEVILGMAHRGRLNVICNIVGKPFATIIHEFEGKSKRTLGSGDVKYHLGTSNDREINGKQVHVSLTANPSHLEAVDPVLMGKVRAKQHLRDDQDYSKVLGIAIHGDAAFAGQGLVSEVFMMADLEGYRIGGTVHFVINNQIGFTTSPQYSRSSPYCTSAAKIIQAPIFHVNGDDPEAVAFASELAIEFRYRFKIDAVVDMVCYRRYGHNESDEPAFTQPMMYRTIAQHPSTRKLYAAQLATAQRVSADKSAALLAEVEAGLQTQYETADSYIPRKADWLERFWAGMRPTESLEVIEQTGVDAAQLQLVGQGLTTVPMGFNLNSKIARQIQAKKQMLETGGGVDWATAEALAFGTLVANGVRVRLSGQDSGRGTFSQRHSVWIDTETEARYIPLNHIREGQAAFEVVDSPLAEASVLGFECGYSLADPHTLVMWEAQFGDFANGAQVIIDQFISAGETKWLRMSGLVMLLPHGYEGQGPEHSSARLERYLQLCAEDNMQVVNCTTPANYFHVLRRQMCRDFRKPLVVMTPKSLLRHKMAVSQVRDMGPGTTFQRVIPMTTVATGKPVRRVVLCSGKVYYDLWQKLQDDNIRDVELVRVEQLYPFPGRELEAVLMQYPSADIVWCQEEPENMGAWWYIRPQIEKVLHAINHSRTQPQYAGRQAAASPATGNAQKHADEQMALVQTALM
jgi:2-oxoglutarate dehydrogenase E1 component